MFQKVLIANRGEIAVRIARTARAMGIETVAVYSEADRNAPHVRICDEAVPIGAAPAAESYLRGDKIVAAARQTGAQAIHPGYGFLSENAGFCEAVESAGLAFVGPSAETIRVMGSKSAAKDLMQEAGVPVTPGYQGADQSIETFKREAARVGYPVLLKATAGGGGKGMKQVSREEELEAGLEAAKREAISAFGDDRFLIEKYVPRARHLEVQIFGDGRGEVIHLYERDCSVQRRHQKIIEEAPAPNLAPEIRQRLLQAGVEAGRAVNYRGAGTVEFLYDGADGIYFMEMNTRLQVEHPVSERITGIDFVDWQFRIAAGYALPLPQEEVIDIGHAFEARLYAENPSKEFAPSVGTLTTLRLPDQHARIDSGVEEGQTISPHYDPMIAKIITHGATRREALGRLARALEDVRVGGLDTNAPFLHRLATSQDFVRGEVSTRYIEEHPDLFDDPDLGQAFLAAAVLYERRDRMSDGNAFAGFRLNTPRQEHFWFEHEGEPALLHLLPSTGKIDIVLEPVAAASARRAGKKRGQPQTFAISGHCTADGTVRLHIGGRDLEASVRPQEDGVRVWIDAEYTDIHYPNPLLGQQAAAAAAGSLSAPMPGVVTQHLAARGAKVSAGDALLSMEAMKMEHTIQAPSDGTLQGFRFAPGDQVKEGDLLADFDPD